MLPDTKSLSLAEEMSLQGCLSGLGETPSEPEIVELSCTTVGVL